MGGSKEAGLRVFSAISSGRARGNGHKLNYVKFYLNIGKHCESGQTVEQVAHGDCGVITLKDTYPGLKL